MATKEINNQQYDMDNAYDRAAYHWELAKVRLVNAKRHAAEMVQSAQEEADNAERNLAQYEIAPGLCDPRFLPFQENGKSISEVMDEVTE